MQRLLSTRAPPSAVHQGTAVRAAAAPHAMTTATIPTHQNAPRTPSADCGLLPVASGSTNALRDDAPPLSAVATGAGGPAVAAREDDPPLTALAERRRPPVASRQ